MNSKVAKKNNIYDLADMLSLATSNTLEFFIV